MEQLKDIKGLVEVTDFSLYYLLGLVGVGAVLMILLALLIYKRVSRKDVMTQQQLAINLLEKFKVDDAKESAYTFSHLAQYAVNEDQREALQELLRELEPYKYKKEVPDLDPDLKKRLEKFVKEVRRG